MASKSAQACSGSVTYGSQKFSLKCKGRKVTGAYAQQLDVGLSVSDSGPVSKVQEGISISEEATTENEIWIHGVREDQV